MRCKWLFVVFVLSLSANSRADLIGYWSADSTNGAGDIILNDQGDEELHGEIFGATYTADGQGHTGQPGDYAIEFLGEDDDYVVIPATNETFEEITITAWVNGFQTGAWAGLVVSRDGVQPIGLDFSDFSGTLAYIWNDNSSDSWGFISDVAVPEEEWTFVALTINSDMATLYSGLAGDELDFAVNEIPHNPQDNFSEWRWAEDDCCGGTRNFAGLMDDVSIWNEALTADDLEQLFTGAKTPLTLRSPLIEGDFDGSGSLDIGDVLLLIQEITKGTNSTALDLTSDSAVNVNDLNRWVKDLRKTWIGDSNLDGEFNSSDFVQVFTAGKFEATDNATWAEGDWNGDGFFNSSDFVAAFTDGGFELGPVGGVQAVPEPTWVTWLALPGLLWLVRRLQHTTMTKTLG
ncbi:MAG: hypothetical protein KDA87_07530 [Planctomycetales bacterium]|nr:hypothetical protein [Planctomycetales bacterium]